MLTPEHAKVIMTVLARADIKVAEIQALMPAYLALNRIAQGHSGESPKALLEKAAAQEG